MAELTIGPDVHVTLSYQLYDERGEVVDRATKTDPLQYVHGYAQVVPGLESNLEGHLAGDSFTFTIDAEEAFGERDDEAVFEVDRVDFPQADAVAAGDEFVAEGPDGEPISMRVVEILKDAFVVDTNHPLAGQRVRFEVEIASVRQASEDEIAEAQRELEEAAHHHHDGCDHDHDHDHGDAGHDHGAATPLVQISKKAAK